MNRHISHPITSYSILPLPLLSPIVTLAPRSFVNKDNSYCSSLTIYSAHIIGLRYVSHKPCHVTSETKALRKPW